jgi:hypothetical protein
MKADRLEKLIFVQLERKSWEAFEVQDYDS